MRGLEHQVRIEVKTDCVRQSSYGGITRTQISDEAMRWLVAQTGGNNARDWFWRCHYDEEQNCNFALFHFADARDAMLFKLTWAGV